MQFRLFGIPIVVTTWFWVTSLAFGLLYRSGTLMASFVAVSFVAVLVHELGHALTARFYGVSPAIVLTAFGGLTSFHGPRLSRGRQIVTTFAGPFAGFLLGALCLVIARLAPPPDAIWRQVLTQAMWCTFGWGVLNLVPVIPLDGGIILREVLGPKRVRMSLILSALAGAALMALFIKLHVFFASLMFGIATLQSVRAAWSYGEIKEEEAARGEAARRELAAAVDALERGRTTDAETRAGTALGLSPDPDVRDAARRLLANVALERGDGMRALAEMGTLETSTPDDDVLRAQGLDAAGERVAAFALLERRANEDPSGPALEALLRGLMATDQIARAVELGLSHVARGSKDAIAFLLEALEARGDDVGASRVLYALFPRVRELRDDPRFARWRERFDA